jgi:hypothetical protein
MSVGIVGAGNMGRSIATQLAKTAEDVTLTDRNLGKAEAVVAEFAGWLAPKLVRCSSRQVTFADAAVLRRVLAGTFGSPQVACQAGGAVKRDRVGRASCFGAIARSVGAQSPETHEERGISQPARALGIARRESPDLGGTTGFVAGDWSVGAPLDLEPGSCARSEYQS